MKVVVLSGSPKGEDSVSLQSLYYIKKKFPEHDYEVFHISLSIKKIIADTGRFESIINAVRNADLVMWVSPVYTLMIPSQLKQFIELIHERNAADAFEGKFAGVLMTSINFFDHCAISYLRSISEDLGMKFTSFFTADTFDLLDENERETLVKFARLMFQKVADGQSLQKAFFPLHTQKRDYTPTADKSSLDLQGKKLLIIQDKDYTNTNLGKMIETFSSSFKDPVEVLNLSDVNIKGGCLGCIRCGFEHECIYDGKDDFTNVFKTVVNSADIIVFAGETKDRWLSAIWKQFFDRAFFNNHIPVMTGKQIGWLISGPLMQLSNLREIADAFIEWQRGNLVDIITDESSSDKEIDAALKQLATGICKASESGYRRPATFLGKGGHKVFRDDIWGRHRFVFQKDHLYYKENGLYDFPHDDEKAIETNKEMMALMQDPDMKKAVKEMIKSEMVKIHKIIVEEAQ